MNDASSTRKTAGPPLRPRRLRVDHPRGLSALDFALLAVLLGAVTGVGAFAFRALIAIIHNAAFLGKLSYSYDTNEHTVAAPWGPGVILVPVVGAAIVAYVVKRFAPEAKGHGVPEVMDAIYYHKSEIRGVVAIVKSLASALSIGTGGSVGREGPIIQIGASFASLSGRIARASRWQRATLVAAGGGAGIAATFNTPIGGLLFAVEVLLHEVSVRTLVPVALATATATFVGRKLFGNAPAFPLHVLPGAAADAIQVLPAAVVLGALMAPVSALFIRALYATEDWFERVLPRREVARHVLGMFGVGVTFYLLLRVSGHYYVQGVGYATIMDVLSGALEDPWFLVALALLKLSVTCVTLGSGASGGVFSPSLFMGATLGGAYGVALHALVPAIAAEPRLFALAGMAALVSGATSATLTAVVMLFEMTLDYTVILPLTLASAVSYGLRRALLPDSIYTLKLMRRGHVMPEALQANAHLVHHVGDIVLSDVITVQADAAPSCIRTDDDAPSHVVVVSDGAIVGVVSRAWALGHAGTVAQAQHVQDIASHAIVVTPSDTTIFTLLALLQQRHASVAVVTAAESSQAAPEILGVVTKDHLAEALAEGMELFAD